MPCQFCKEIQYRDFKLRKITCHDCKGLFRRENVRKRYFGKKPLKINQENYEKFISQAEMRLLKSEGKLP